jgi:hypothetical protein
MGPLADHGDGVHHEDAGPRTARFVVVETTTRTHLPGGARPQYCVQDFRKKVTHWPGRVWERAAAQTLRDELEREARRRGEAVTVPLTPGTATTREARGRG